MDQSIFDTFARRISVLLDRRSLVGGLSGILLSAGLAPVAVESKKKGRKKRRRRKRCRKRAGLCRQEFLENCEDDDVDDSGACQNAINTCCKKAAKCKIKSVDKLFDRCFDVLCQFKSLC